MVKDLLIQKYINNRLTKEEQVLFDDLYKNDADFIAEVKLHKDLKAAIRNEERISLKKEFKKKDVNKVPFNWARLLVAASFAMLLSVGSYFMFKDSGLTNQELFATNFEPYRNVMHPVVRGEENLTQIEEAFVFYENGDFSKFIKIIESANYKDTDYNFYLANAYLANENVEKAKLILEDYLHNNDAKFFTKAHWYLGLIYLKLADTQKAKNAFNVVKKRGDFNVKKVNTLLKNLK